MKANLDKFKEEDSKEDILDLISDINLLWDIDKHGITAPPEIMWGVDDEIRAKIKNA